MERIKVLEEASQLISVDRNTQYGEPIDDFSLIAKLWEGYLRRLMETRNLDVLMLDPHDVSVLLILVKISRLAQTPEKKDHWADMAGYAGCGWECVTQTYLS